MRLPRALAAVLLGFLLPACAQRPEEVVDGYFRALRSDPVRSLILTTRAFHEHHGVRRVRTAAEGPAPDREADEGPDDPATARLRARARLGWLLAINMASFHHVNDQIGFERISVSVDEDRATVVTRVSAIGTTPFLQTFTLRRSQADGTWRIDEIAQEDVRIGSRGIAFAAFPSRTNHEAAILQRTARERPGELPR